MHFPARHLPGYLDRVPKVADMPKMQDAFFGSARHVFDRHEI